jgi:4-amino-4-deoxy-L-arabinose transferase-like glycosyltransferase
MTLVFVFLLPEKAGVAIVGLTGIIAIGVKQIRSDWRLLSIVLLTLAAHHILSVTNAFYTTLKGADVDAIGFHETATLMASSIQPEWFGEFGGLDVGSKFYSRWLSVFYQFFGVSMFLGQELSVLAYLGSCILLIKFTNLLGIRHWRLGIVALYGLLPSVVIFTSITMRESYQIFLYLLLAYQASRLRQNPSVKKVSLIISAGLGLAILHNGLIIYALFIISLGLLWGLRIGIKSWRRQTIVALLVAFTLIISIIIAWTFFANDMGGASRALILGEGADYAGVYRDRTTTSYDRASYGGKLDTSSFTAFIPSAAMVFVMYMFAPFPWQISDAVDVYGAVEGYLRLLLIYQALATWYRASGERRSQWGFLLVCFFSLEFLWALGTANWGTAIRHHTVAYCLLVLTGGPGLFRMIIKPFSKLKRKAPRARFVTVLNKRGFVKEVS